MTKKRELRLMIEECDFCSLSSEEFCTRHQGMIDELPPEFVVRCASCGEIYTGVPEKGKVECVNCNKILMQNKEVPA